MRILKALGLAMMAVVMSACQSSAPSDLLESVSAKEHAGDQWVLEAGVLAGKALDLSILEADNRITLTFYEQQALVGQSAVNNYRVPVTVKGAKIEHTGPVISTLMAAPVELMNLEHQYLQAMEKVAEIQRKGAQLVLVGDGVRLQYRAL